MNPNNNNKTFNQKKFPRQQHCLISFYNITKKLDDHPIKKLLVIHVKKKHDFRIESFYTTPPLKLVHMDGLDLKEGPLSSCQI